MSALRYVYGIARASDAPTIESARISGIDGGRVNCVAEGELLAAASDVDESDYGSLPLNEHVSDLEWLAARAAQHQAVNGRLLELCGTVLPLSFGAIYRDDERVREMLREDRADRAERLATLEGRSEWVLTVSRDADSPIVDDDVRALDEEIAVSPPGRAFLLDKRRGSAIARSLERRDAEAASEALDVLVPVVERSYREPVATGGTDAVVLRASVLLPRDRERALASAIGDIERRLGGRGYRVRASGPWPAYRFGGMP
ncbi:MAG TPA: GvpL/GvpF family gas vesicle protein [Candidatus Limnocylindria bacterium]|nr:GvpL/GvpF family gas vesicle protein [Candidatus Limnocylindria bacterium]